MIDAPVHVCTIGFTKTTASNFFGRLKTAGVTSVIDVRLNNTSQLSGFAKSDDLTYFLEEIAGIKYRHIPLLAPDKELLSSYRKGSTSWLAYESEFLKLMKSRRIEERVSPSMFERSCLLCSEDKPHHCHRRLVCEYLNSHWQGQLRVRHL